MPVKARRTVALAALFGVQAAVLVAFFGACAGWWLVRFVPPTNGDVREAASSLAPPGFTITESSAGYRGGYPVRGPYGASIRLAGGGTVEERVVAVQAQTAAQGWRLIETRNRPNGIVQRYERGRLRATVSVYLDSPISSAGARRSSEPDLYWKLPCSTAGAALGFAIWLLLGTVLTRRHSAAGQLPPQVPMISVPALRIGAPRAREGSERVFD